MSETPAEKLRAAAQRAQEINAHVEAEAARLETEHEQPQPQPAEGNADNGDA